MPVDPLVPFTDLVTSGSESVEDGEFVPIGIQSAVAATPIMPAPLSQEAWQMMDPNSQADYVSQLVTGEPADDDEGNFEDDADLDTSQVAPGRSLGTPLPVPPVAQLPDSQWRDDVKAPGGLLSAPPPLEDHEPKSRADDIGYRYSEFVRGLSQRFNHLFGMDKDGDAGREHLMNAWDPDRNNAPDLPVSEDQIGMPIGSYAKEAPQTPQTPQTIMAPGANTPAVSLYSQKPDEWQYVSDDPQRAAQILSVAESMINNSANPGDLVQRAYAAAGIDAPNLIDFQLEMGESVPLNELKPGDLVGWSDKPGAIFRDNVGIMLMDGTVVRAGRFGEPARVFDLHTVPRDALYGVRINHPERDRRTSGGVTLNADEQEQYRKAMEAVHNVLSGVFGGISQNQRKKTGRKKRRRDRDNNDGGGRVSKKNRREGRGDINDGDSWEPRGDGGSKYSGIGATK